MIIRGKWAAILLTVLIVSVAANLFVFGFVVANAPGWDRGPVLERVVARFTRGFPDPLRDAVRGQLERKQDDFLGAYGSMRDARQRAFDLMRAEPLDRPALEAALGDVRRNVTVMQTLGHEAVVNGLAEVPADVRTGIEKRKKRRSWFKRD